jgi:hypothetical protein
MVEEIISSETSVRSRATRRHIPEGGFLKKPQLFKGVVDINLNGFYVDKFVPIYSRLKEGAVSATRNQDRVRNAYTGSTVSREDFVSKKRRDLHPSVAGISSRVPIRQTWLCHAKERSFRT